jgi:2-dehydropantoate 2-reductase
MKMVIVGQGAMGLLLCARKFLYEKIKTNHFIQKPLKDSMNTEIRLLCSTPSSEQHFIFDFQLMNGTLESIRIKRATQKDLSTASLWILCIKAHQTLDFFLKYQSLLFEAKEPKKIILLQNGMGCVDELPRFILKQHIFMHLLTHEGCMRITHHHICHMGNGVSYLGFLKTTSKQKQLLFKWNDLIPMFENLQWSDHIVKKQWNKLAINSVINPLTALHQCYNGELLEKKWYTQIKGIIKEIVIIAKAENIHLNASYLFQNVQKTAYLTKKNMSSMRADIQKKRATEIQFINGYIHKLGIKHNIKTIENTRLMQAIEQLEKKE